DPSSAPGPPTCDARRAAATKLHILAYNSAPSHDHTRHSTGCAVRGTEMKKLINDPRTVVREMLEGLVDLAPGQALLESEDVVLRADLPSRDARREVSVLSGGGSGHEPAHAGYVGAGMLHAAIAGDVFTSPSVDAVLAGIRAVAGRL